MAVPDSDVLWLSRLPYASLESCLAGWRAASIEVVDVPAEVEVWPFDMPEMDHPALLLEKEAS